VFERPIIDQTKSAFATAAGGGTTKYYHLSWLLVTAEDFCPNLLIVRSL
jgi:hypothetical protein